MKCKFKMLTQSVSNSYNGPFFVAIFSARLIMMRVLARYVMSGARLKIILTLKTEWLNIMPVQKRKSSQAK